MLQTRPPPLGKGLGMSTRIWEGESEGVKRSLQEVWRERATRRIGREGDELVGGLNRRRRVIQISFRRAMDTGKGERTLRDIYRKRERSKLQF